MSKFFKISEFTNSETAKRLNIDNSFKDDISDLRIKELVKCLLTPLREKFGRIKINSGYRCPELNKAVGGVPNSHHMLGTCADCVFIDANIDEVWEYLKTTDINFTQAGVYKSRGFIHLEYDKDNLKRKMFVK